MSILSYFYTFTAEYIQQQKEMKQEFERRRELARNQYWEASKFPRKKKKMERKKAKADFEFYSDLSQSDLLNL